MMTIIVLSLQKLQASLVFHTETQKLGRGKENNFAKAKKTYGVVITLGTEKNYNIFAMALC